MVVIVHDERGDSSSADRDVVVAPGNRVSHARVVFAPLDYGFGDDILVESLFFSDGVQVLVWAGNRLSF